VDPILENARNDLDDLAQKYATELHEANDHTTSATRYLQILERYGPSMLEAVIRVGLRLAGVPVIPPLPPLGSAPG
jgi:hypothetical protein